jgi:AcrR family transcriptional regulator
MKQKVSAKRGRPSRRLDIIAATESLLRNKGLSGVTTRAIANEVGCSEAAIYVHFNGRLALLLAVLEEGLPNLLGPLQTLEQSVGKSTPHKNLAKAFRAIYGFQESVVPVMGSLFADPELLVAYRAALKDIRKPPHGPMGTMQRYIAAEQELGRLSRDLDSEMAATVLVSTAFFGAFLGRFFGEPNPSGAPIRKLAAAATVRRLITAAIGVSYSDTHGER